MKTVDQKANRAYRTQTVLSASPAVQIVMLYDQVIRSLERAIAAIGELRDRFADAGQLGQRRLHGQELVQQPLALELEPAWGRPRAWPARARAPSLRPAIRPPPGADSRV